jgi:tetratricopeptide (TPR) repeat protein
MSMTEPTDPASDSTALGGNTTVPDAVQPHLATAQTGAAEADTPDARRLGLNHTPDGEELLHKGLLPAEQLVWFQNALAAARAIGDRSGESQALAGLGLANSALGDERGAILYYKQWLTIATELGDHHGESQALFNMGHAHYQLGDARSALKCYAQSLVIFREAGERRSEGIVLSNLGDVYAALGDTRRAVESYSESLAILQEIADQHFEAIVRWSMGELLAGQGEYNRAAEFMQALVDYERAAGHPDAEHHATILAQVRARVK